MNRDRYHITTKEEYDYCLQRGIQPLIYDDVFEIDINLRVELQKELFGKDIKKANQRFFKWIWQHKEHVCEECQRPLQFYSATFCSHILSRGAHPEMAHDGRNINILCFEHHNQYEFGNREQMRIFDKNQKMIERLKFEYSQLNSKTWQ